MRSRSHATNTISTWNFLMVESGKTFSSLIFWKNGAVKEFHGAIDISYQIMGQSFLSSAVWNSRSGYTRELVRQQACNM